MTRSWAAAAAAAADGRSVVLSVPKAIPGDVIRATGTGWPGGQLIQIVTCGELALPGSSSCDMPGAIATTVKGDGTFALDIVIGDPPRPCPCVVHVASVGAGEAGHVDSPIEIVGHKTGPTPVPGRTSTVLEVIEARLTGGGSVSAWFGGAQHRTLVYTIRNAGPGAVTGVPLTVRVGRSEDAVPAPSTGELRAGQTRTYEVAVTIPFAAFGDYPVTVEVAGAGRARAVHSAYPWGLVLVNLLGLVLIAVGVARRVRRVRVRGHGPALAADADVLLPSVVRVPSLGAYLVFDDAPGTGRLRRLSGGQLATPDLRELLEHRPESASAVVDLEALDDYLAARQSEGVTRG
ncbi:hypothetical protein F4553_006758 [Allocatelliglobosispora scoriae]|uniref:Uncharacterized protein n=1 Tax=Allocatelliglobosispora scoriae TaxID=643052 RepID=A0A841BYW1_9ACTN|nr:hypothetical protein [Allocatelliglobosispora scoriae]MBB5873324.1 hypothetical protein [Allocatelliglobosispora scoriae]